MNDKFKNKAYTAEQRRGANRFRYFVSKRRILRHMQCAVCDKLAFTTGEIEAHHLDYKRWWIVSWLCRSCHRKVDHGSLMLKKKHIFDYWSVVAPFVQPMAALYVNTQYRIADSIAATDRLRSLEYTSGRAAAMDMDIASGHQTAWMARDPDTNEKVPF